VAGVTVSATRNAAAIGKATAASDGTWEIPLPGSGRYTITLDVATLPPGRPEPGAGGRSDPEERPRPLG